ncbi:hypothetical protein AQUCO_02700443v1 [Aquilegia coerulea]|uniref:BZIP domain-containing protein n=1 Tax=Aquilegia coerulea TaxID=218851 RepID=A0A2G5D6X7_AQUCA|nr:hypothetical protein AQUCO_02700443v1 [Aquilegia coerulea]
MAADERDNKEEIRVFVEKENPNLDLLERCSAASCSSSSSAVVAANNNNNTSVDDLKRKAADRMVEIELDAARALADFAQLALLQSGNNSVNKSTNNWGNKRKRSTKRVKNESLEWGKNFGTIKLKSSDLVQLESNVVDKQCHKKVRKAAKTKKVKAEQALEVPRSTPQCSTSCVPSGGGRSIKNQLTEAEKEAKRLRRILANRESARQTIRRRQEKELVMKEYQLLKDKNEYLKVQIARAIKGEKEDVSSSPIKAVASSSEKQQPLLVYSGPTITPLVWSSVIQPLNPIQTQPLTHDPMVPACKLEPSDEQGFAVGANGMRPPFYLMPCPWFFSLGNRLYPHPMDSFGVVDKQDGSSFGNPGDQVPSLKVTEDHVENHHPRDVPTDTFSPNGAKFPNNHPDTSIRLAPSEENHLFGSHANGLNSTATSCKSVELTMAIKCEDRFQQDSIAKEESGSSTSSHTTIHGHAVYHGQKLVDATVAAEARKRRKELTRLKNHNGRQLRLHC